jgi:hypothetical protein
MKPLTAFKLVCEATGAEGGQEMTLILTNIDAQEVDLHVGERYTLEIQQVYPEERLSALPEH